LWELWLLDAGADGVTQRAVEWLMEKGQAVREGICGGVYDGLFFRVGREDRAALRRPSGTVFTPGCSGFVMSGAALFFATVFGQGDAGRREAAYRRLEAVGRMRHGRWCSSSCGNNILQAFATDPVRRECGAMKLAVKALGEVQDGSGAWGRGTPFFPTLWALARVGTKGAREQVRRAVACAAAKQRGDGSFGGTWRAERTWMLLDAMECAGIRWEVG
jgi:hypothetical protein